MRLSCLLGIWIAMSLSGFAQVADTTLVTFHVTGSQTSYQVFPKDSILWGGQDNLIRIVATGRKREAFTQLLGGRIVKCSGRDSLYKATVDDTVMQVLLTIREKLPGGKTKLVLTKPYRIRRISPPVVYVCGVKSDSVIDRQQMIVQDLLYARSELFSFRLVIESFDMTFSNASGDLVLHSPNNHFTVDQRREIYKLQSGNIVYFQNIRYLMPGGDSVVLRPIQIYVDDTNKYKVGERKVGK